jgi:hypothetical protein
MAMEGPLGLPLSQLSLSKIQMTLISVMEFSYNNKHENIKIKEA